MEGGGANGHYLVARLTADLAGSRLDRANLLAAIRAALAAAAGGADPLYYLRGELDGRWRPFPPAARPQSWLNHAQPGRKTILAD